MRTGAIFARGSCRALRWMALAGMVFALGAGQAVAQKPSKPVLTAVEGVTSSSVKLTWTVPGGGPAITMGFVTQTNTTSTFTDADPSPVTDSGPTTREATISGVSENTRTYYRVGAKNTAGTTWSNVRDYTTENAPPAPIFGDTTIGDGQVTLSWTAVEANNNEPDYYEYNYKPGVVATQFVTPADAARWTRVAGGSGARGQVVSGLTNGTSYVFGVRAVNNGGPAEASPQVEAIPSGKPEAPTDLTVTLGTPTSAGKVDVTLAWTEPESDGGSAVDYYEYEIDGFRTWTPTDDSNTFEVISGLDADMAAGYTYRVRAVNSNGAGLAVSSDGTGGTTPPRTTDPTTGGEILSITISGADEKDIDGERWHLDEGDHTRVTVTIEWEDEDLDALWADGKPDDAVVMIDADARHQQPALAVAGRDKPRCEHRARVRDRGRGSQGADDRQSRQEFRLDPVHPGAGRRRRGRGVQARRDEPSPTSTTAGEVESEIFVIEDAQTQGITLERVDSGYIFEGGDDVEFEVTASPSRVNLDLDVRFDLDDVTGETVASRDNRLDVSRATIGVGPDAEETVTVTLDGNDENRVNDKLRLTAEVVPYALDTGAFEGIGSKELEFDVIDVHKLPPLTVAPAEGTVMEGSSIDADGVDQPESPQHHRHR